MDVFLWNYFSDSHFQTSYLCNLKLVVKTTQNLIKMIEIGKYNTLTILRDTKVGLFLGNPEKDPEGIHDILLPNKYVPNEFEIGEELIVFAYLDHEQRPVATTLEPYILLNEFALLRVNYINQIGA